MNPRKGEDKRIRPNTERLLLPHVPVQFFQASSEDKSDAEQFIAEQFNIHYQAEITHFLPYLLSTKTGGSFTAVMGIQPAATKSSLFLEQYLTLSIEDEISRITQGTVERNKIAEVGNLSSVHRGTSQLLFVLTVAILHKAGFEWSVFTATKQVQHLLAKLNLVTITLCEANPDKLLDKQQSWGSYYADKPNVLIGNLTDAYILLKEHKVIGFILKNYQNTIQTIAKRVKQQ